MGYRLRRLYYQRVAAVVDDKSKNGPLVSERPYRRQAMTTSLLKIALFSSRIWINTVKINQYQHFRRKIVIDFFLTITKLCANIIRYLKGKARLLNCFNRIKKKYTKYWKREYQKNKISLLTKPLYSWTTSKSYNESDRITKTRVHGGGVSIQRDMRVYWQIA
jgi:hypothetical protein